MESKQIRSLAGEPPHVRGDRDRYTNQLEKLEAGLRTLNILNTDGTSLSPPVVLGKRMSLWNLVTLKLTIFLVSRAVSPFDSEKQSNGGAE